MSKLADHKNLVLLVELLGMAHLNAKGKGELRELAEIIFDAGVKQGAREARQIFNGPRAAEANEAGLRG